MTFGDLKMKIIFDKCYVKCGFPFLHFITFKLTNNRRMVMISYLQALVLVIFTDHLRNNSKT